MHLEHGRPTDVARHGFGRRLLAGARQRARPGRAGTTAPRTGPAARPGVRPFGHAAPPMPNRSGRNASNATAGRFPSTTSATHSAVIGASRMPLRKWPVA